MSHYGNNQNIPERGSGRYRQQEYPKKVHYSQEGQDRYEARSFDVGQNYYESNTGNVDSTRRNSVKKSVKHPEQHRKSQTEAQDGRNRYPNSNGTSSAAPIERQYRHTGGQTYSTLYGGNSAPVQVNAMNAPNNSTIQCGCENIDCPFCNLMLSVEMKQ